MLLLSYAMHNVVVKSCTQTDDIIGCTQTDVVIGYTQIDVYHKLYTD